MRTASTFECLLEDPFEREAPLPLLELRDLLLDFGLAFAFTFEAFDFAVDLDFEAGFAAFEDDAFFDLGFGFDVDLDLGFDFDLGVDLDFV
ncbi:MAG TPA: hypothetical protein VFU11_12640 [Solirubrobacterales bacterium]|nr:hypothetical protein [Solirubrobacterales bacterium]